ncbi:uncharacterized protein [Setaria viridis]|uniref:Cathepsin propeptide inhibitor domain-containing protein n=1 Tax=Setaria viridis TaxID=4556 RepID=A0A4U6TFK0_SETVI|nr:uncharacterized protein LOC117833929 [Setaria viridis]TKW01041.1 hypothetical protein SEVIR_8G151000v2 [Setaria viridis]
MSRLAPLAQLCLLHLAVQPGRVQPVRAPKICFCADSPPTSPPFGRCLSSHMARSNQGAPAPVGRFVFDDKDLESDEALWALYERWCKFWGEERSREEMQRCFDDFKDCALFVHRANKNGGRLELNMFADGKQAGGLIFADRKENEKRHIRVRREVFERLPNKKSLLMGSAGHSRVNNKGSEEEDFIDLLV